MHAFPQGTKPNKFSKLKGVLLACSSVSRVVLGEEPGVFAFQFAPDPKQRGAMKKEAAINSVKVLPVIDPGNVKDTERCFKAGLSQVKREKIEIVVILPF